MDQWTSSASPQGRVWRRPLGIGEASFFWDSVIDGAFDAVQYEEVDLDSSRLDVMSPDNIERTWLAVKRRFPLISARIIRSDDDQVHFEVSEERVRNIVEGELVTESLTSREEIIAFHERFLSGPRLLTSRIKGNKPISHLAHYRTHRIRWRSQHEPLYDIHDHVDNTITAHHVCQHRRAASHGPRWRDSPS